MKINNHKGYTKLVLAFLLVVTFGTECFSQSRTFLTDGLFDTRKLNLREERVALSGHWDFYPAQLLHPSKLNKHKRSTLLVPSLWNEHPEMQNVGFGTYSLRLILPPSTEKWALEIPQLYNSYALYINDSLYASNGKPSDIKEKSQLEWRPQFVAFQADSDTITITIQLSNFHHFKGGIREPIYFGSASMISGHFNNAMSSVIVEVVILVLVAMFFLFVWYRKKERIALYFSLLCLSWGIRECFSDMYPISTLFPGINWFFLVRTEYIMLFLITIYSNLFVNRLFSDLSSKIFKYLAVFINCVFIVFVLFTPVVVFTRWMPLYLLTAATVLIYSAVIIIRAMILEKTGAWFLITGLILAIVAIGYDIIAYKGNLSNHIMVGSICYILIYTFSAIGLLQHLKIIRSSESPGNTLRYQDLYR
jgi:hypothetical protein